MDAPTSEIAPASRFVSIDGLRLTRAEWQALTVALQYVADRSCGVRGVYEIEPDDFHSAAAKLVAHVNDPAF